MKLVIPKIFAFLAVNIYFGFAFSFQNEGNEELFQNYNLHKLVKKSVEDIYTSQSLKLLSSNETASLNEFEKSFMVSINSLLLKMLPEVASNKCVEDTKYVFESLLSPADWAMQMLDSYGKPESGILMGNTRWLGQFDECIGIHAPFKENNSAGGFNGKYCTLQVPINLETLSLRISTAVCLPDSCNPNGTYFNIIKNSNLNGPFSDAGKRMESVLSKVALTCKDTSFKLPTATIVFICLVLVFVLLAVIGSSITAFEYYMDVKSMNRDSGSDFFDCFEKCKPFFNLFCIFTNGKKILDDSSNKEQLSFLHGIRFLSMSWVILLHVYFTVARILRNDVVLIDYIDRFLVQIIIKSCNSVDSFFILSGFLVSYVFFQQAQKTDGKYPWLYFYVHRYIRLAPAYLMVLAFHTTVSPFLGSGPLWLNYDVDEGCKENWWWNILFINNFLSITSKECMEWSWYLACDMQFFVISPLFLITLWRWPKAGYSLLGLGFCITFACNFVLTYEYDLFAGIGNTLKNMTDLINIQQRLYVFCDMIYNRPYSRIGPYLIGLALAYYLHRRKVSKATSLNCLTLSVGWIFTSGITLVCLFGLYHQALTKLEASFYNAFNRVGFVLGVGWVIFACVIGQGGVVDSMLSWKPFIPLSRLSYCAYLVHPIIIRTYVLSMRTLIYFTHINMVMMYFSALVISFAVSFVVSLLFEIPAIRMNTLIRKKFAS